MSRTILVARKAGPTYSPAESAVQLPNTAIWISQQGVTQASGTVSAWSSYLGGVSCTLTQGTVGSQPAYSASGGVGGLPLITTDGVDDYMVGAITKGSAWSDYEIGVAGARVATGIAGAVWLGYQQATLVRFFINDQNSLAARFTVSGGANLSFTTDPDGVIAQWSGEATSGGTINARRGSVIEATTAAAVTSRVDGGNVVLGAQESGTAPANIAVQAFWIGPALTADQRTYLQALITHYTGI